MKGPSKKKRLNQIIELICALVFAFSVTYIIANKVMDYKSEKSMEELQAMVHVARNVEDKALYMNGMGVKNTSLESSDGDNSQNEQSEAEPQEEETKTDDLVTLSEAFNNLHDKNENFYGWILIDGTKIDYPLMQGPDNAFYLEHNINNEKDKRGMLIMDTKCDINSKNAHLIVYGHNVHDGDLFGELINYKDTGYEKYHPYIQLDSIYGSKKFKVFAAFRTTVEEAQEDEALFTTYSYDTLEDFNKMLEWVDKKALYDTGVKPEYGDEILSLVTCEYTKENGRFVVMAGRVLE